ncbi:hypothetical protein LJC74_04625 [Eubacteriales bacterium OttesenSCG-928-A19]|nr:hypothetical protein [Eubacteriales bacterium OttesenSCG-928-A19]
MARKKIIPIETNKLEEALRLIPEGRRVVGEKLLAEIEFLSGALSQLKATVIEEGVESAALKTYNTTIQRYALLYKQFSDLLPRQTGESGDNALLDFIKKG